MAEKNSANEPKEPMDPEEFRKWGKKMIDYAADYWTTIRDRKPFPDVKPGYIWDLMPDQAPAEPESWDDIFKDLEKTIVGPNTHWHHPTFFAYYPTANSYAAIMGDILSATLGCIGFTWNSSPSCTELEMVVMDWLAKAMDLPEHFLNAHSGPGAGMIQCTASDSTLVGLLAARSKACRKAAEKTPGATENSFFPKLVAYCSDQAHSSVERAALLSAIRMRQLKTFAEDDWGLRADTLETAVKEDLELGNIPFFVCGTVGATSCCSIDKNVDLGRVCQQYDLWFHIDAAYAGSAAIVPKYRHLINGVELADSFNFNCHKWMMVNFDCSAMWFKNGHEIEHAFLVDPLYLKTDNKNVVPDYRHWQIPLGRRFRSIKLWMVMRSFGISGIQRHITSMCDLATLFESLVKADEKYEVFIPVTLGLICFRLKGANEPNEKLLKLLNEDRRIHLVPSQTDGTYYLRLAICSSLTNEDDIRFAWSVIKEIEATL